MKVFLFFLLILSFTVNTSASLDNFFDHLFSRNKCPIKLYNPKDSSFTGVKLYTHCKTFHPLLQILSIYAKECCVKIHIKQSFVQDNSSIIHDHNALAFRLGEAIEFELVDHNDELLCNELCMGKDVSRLSGLPDAKCFLKKLKQNSDLQQDMIKPTILIKRTKPNDLPALRDRQNKLQNKCRKLNMNS